MNNNLDLNFTCRAFSILQAVIKDKIVELKSTINWLKYDRLLTEKYKCYKKLLKVEKKRNYNIKHYKQLIDSYLSYSRLIYNILLEKISLNQLEELIIVATV